MRDGRRSGRWFHGRYRRQPWDAPSLNRSSLKHKEAAVTLTYPQRGGANVAREPSSFPAVPRGEPARRERWLWLGAAAAEVAGFGPGHVGAARAGQADQEPEGGDQRVRFRASSAPERAARALLLHCFWHRRRGVPS